VAEFVAGHKWIRNTPGSCSSWCIFVLLIGAGIDASQSAESAKVNPGFNPEKVLVMRVTPSFTKFNTTQATAKFV